MSVSDRSLLDLKTAEDFNDNDTVVSVVSGKASRIKFGHLLNRCSQWNNIRNKPFDGINSDDFTISADKSGRSTALSINPSITKKSHDHTNKIYLDKISEDNEGKLLYDNSPVDKSIEWNSLPNKPFEKISQNDFSVNEYGIVFLNDNIKSNLHAHENYDVLGRFGVDKKGRLLFDNAPIVSDGVDFSSLSSMLIEGNNISIATDKTAQTITFSASGMDFPALSEALTSGTQNGISVSADTENNRINFEVTGIPNLAIDSEGYFTINGIRGDNPTKAQGENGADGFSPTAVIEQTEIGAKITVTDKNGETSADLINGADGITPTINGTTKHWMIGETDTGVVAEGTTTVQTTAVNYIGTLTADNWIGNAAPYTQTVNITGITAESSPIVDLVLSDTVETGLEEMKQWGYISKAVTDDNTITFSCYKTKPTITINFKVKVV